MQYSARQFLAVCLLTLLSPTTAFAADAPVCKPGESLSLGVFPRSNPAQTDAMFTPIAARLSAALGCRIELKTAADFTQFWKGVEGQTYDLVHYNQYHYLKSAQHYEVIARNEESGSSLMRGALFARVDSDIHRLSDLAGKKIIFGGGPDAMMSHIVPRYLLLEAGLLPTQYQWEYAPNPPNAIMAVYYRQAHAAGGGDAVVNLPIITKNLDKGQLKMVAQSEPVPQLPWSVKRSLANGTKRRIQAALFDLPRSDAGRQALAAAGMSGIAAAVDADYDGCRAIVKRVQSAFTIE